MRLILPCYNKTLRLLKTHPREIKYIPHLYSESPIGRYNDIRRYRIFSFADAGFPTMEGFISLDAIMIMFGKSLFETE